MNTPQNDGGAAFPQAFDPSGDIDPHGGMTLRDYFAAQALTGYLAYSHPASIMGTFIDESAKVAYEYADAMLKAREGKL